MDLKQTLVMAAAAALGVSMSACDEAHGGDPCTEAQRIDAGSASGELGCCAPPGSEMLCGSRPSTEEEDDAGRETQ